MKIETKTDLIEMIDFAITATNLNDEYSRGLRNGLRLAKSFIDGEEPNFERGDNNVR